jgi:hypothetical protein
MLRQFFLLLSLFFVLNSLLFLTPKPSVLGTTTVTASIDTSCAGVTIKITPENRIPPTGNDALEINVDIRHQNSSTSLYNTTFGTDNGGQGSFCIPPGIITAGHYDVYVKGLSHLRRIFPYREFLTDNTTLDIRNPVLWAGDSHPTSDNYVNSMDISYEILKIYTNDLRADLNRDSIVNSLEFPTLLSHLYQYGDN